jgi:2-phospho-L-lactate guanylyltransferase
MKDPALAKTRLADALDDAQRMELAVRMFENTISFLRTLLPTMPLGVVTPSPRIEALARDAGATVVDDGLDSDINHAAVCARDWALSIRASSLMIIHADIPLLFHSEFDQLFDARQSTDVVIGESLDGGTNVLIGTPPNVLEFSFGLGSAARHEEMARAQGLSVKRVAPFFLSRDVDRPEDLYLCERLRQRPIGPELSS